MRVHLYTTDVSGLRLASLLPPDDEISVVLVPQNRANSEKVAEVRARAGVPVLEHARGRAMGEQLPPGDAVISWMYSQIIAVDDLARYPAGGMNMHGGQLPRYRGANVLQWAIINGESEMGVTWHALTAELDAGGILAESTIPISLSATAADLRSEMIEEGLRLFPAAWRRLADGDPPIRVPDVSQGDIWPRRKPEDGRIGHGWSERRVRDMVRALCPPWPSATIASGDGLLSVAAVHDAPGEHRLAYDTAEGTRIFLETRTEL